MHKGIFWYMYNTRIFELAIVGNGFMVVLFFIGKVCLDLKNPTILRGRNLHRFEKSDHFASINLLHDLDDAGLGDWAHAHALARTHAGYTHVVNSMVPRARDLLDWCSRIICEDLHCALEGKGTSLCLVLLSGRPCCLGVVHLAEIWHHPEVVLVLVLVVRAVEDAEWVCLDEVGILSIHRHRCP
jgi:hypothetical protein